MSLASVSVRRPVFTLMITLAVLVLGSVALSRLQIDLLPNIELPTITVRTSYAGADPVVMERLVTTIVEEIIATVPGVVEMTSRSYEGNSRIRVSFAWGTNIDTVALDVRATIEDEISELPDEIGSVRVSKFDIDTFPVVILGVSSTLDPVELTEIVETQIRYRLSRIPGVAQVDPWGGFNREIRIELDPARINAYGVPMDDIISAVRDANLDLPAGKIESGRHQVTLRAPAEFSNLEQIMNTVVGRKDSNLVTLRQVAEVRDTHERLSRIIRINGNKGLRLAIRKQPGENTVDVANRVITEAEAINAAYPQISVIPVTNQGNFIERAIANVSNSILYGGMLALIVLFTFLRDVRSTLVIAIAIPISVVATFALMYFSGFTLNLMTLGGLALGVGMMVDSSVVVLENIYRNRRELQLSSVDAAVSGTNEVTSAVIAGTVTTLVIFLPLIFVQGVTGVLFKELAFIIMFSLSCALLVALSLVPMLSARLVSNPASKNSSSPAHVGGLASVYRDFLNAILKARFLTLTLVVGVFVASLALVPLIGTEFMPPSDEGQVRISGTMEVGTRIELLDRQTRMLEELVIPAVPEAVSSVVSVTSSGTFGRSTASGDIRLTLKPAGDRARSNLDVARDLRKLIEGKVPGMKIRVRAPQGQFLLERILATTDGIIIEVRGFDFQILDVLAKRVAKQIEGIEGITDIELSRETGIPQIEILVDRAKTADLGLSVRDISRVIETSIAGSTAGEYRVDGNSYRILLRLADAEKRSLDEILDLTVRTADGGRVALRNVVSTRSGSGPVTIERKDQQRLMTVTANVSDRDLGSVAAEIQQRLSDIPKPVGYDTLIAGNFAEQEKSYKELLISIVLALLLVYMVLASQYESFIDPLVVMFAVPFAAVGVILTLFLTDTTLNLQSGVGCIMLVGIAVNNAILLVDQTSRLRGTGMTVDMALAEAGRRRLRPILMTTLTTMLALLPLALGVGEGADAQAPMARTVIGGLLVSTLVALVLIPVLYSLFNRGHSFSSEANSKALT